jgi:hypothetical protein
MSFDSFLESAWNDHGDHPRAVADRLAASIAVVAAPEQVAPFARLVTHVYGEHLGEWAAGIALLESLRGMAGVGANPAAAGAIDRGVATLRYARGDRDALAALAVDDRAAVLATAASIFTARNDFSRALAAYAAATQVAAGGLPTGSPAVRALAVAGNNLAAGLEEKSDRSAAETAGMVHAAEGGLTYWTLAGTWLEEERALYRLARSLLAAGEPERATARAQRCIDVCERNAAAPFERFFGYAALAIAQRAAGDRNGFLVSREHAFELHRQIPAEDRSWCEADLSLLAD